jgi:hypothetical protein
MASSNLSKFDIKTKYKMNSGYEIPALGYGVSSLSPFSGMHFFASECWELSL